MHLNMSSFTRAYVLIHVTHLSSHIHAYVLTHVVHMSSCIWICPHSVMHMSLCIWIYVLTDSHIWPHAKAKTSNLRAVEHAEVKLRLRLINIHGKQSGHQEHFILHTVCWWKATTDTCTRCGFQNAQYWSDALVTDVKFDFRVFCSRKVGT